MIQINSTPKRISPAFSHDGIVFMVGSFPPNNVNHKLVANVYARNKPTMDPTLIGKKRQTEHLGQFRFDISGILQSYLSHDATEGISQYITPNTQGSAIQFYVKFTQEYVDTSTGLYVVGESLNTANFYALNSAVDAKVDFYDYVCSFGSQYGGKFLTEQPLVKRVRKGEVEQLHFSTDTPVRVRTSLDNGVQEPTEVTTIKANFKDFTIDQLRGQVTWNRSNWKFNELGIYLRGVDIGGGFQSGLSLTSNYIEFSGKAGRLDSNGDERFPNLVTEWVSEVTEFSFQALSVKKWGIPEPADVQATVYGWYGTSWVSVQVFSIDPIEQNYSVTNAETVLAPYTRFKIQTNNALDANMALRQVQIVGKPFDTSEFQFKRGIIHLGEMFSDYSSQQGQIDVWLEDYGGAQVSDTMSYQLDPRCKPQHSVRFTWMNRLGGFDSHTFTASRTEARNIDKKVVEKNLPFNYTTKQPTRMVSNVQSDVEYTLYAEIENENDNTWLSHIMESPMVYIQQPNGTLKPVLITNQPKAHYDSDQWTPVAVKYIESVRRIIPNG